MTYPSKKDWWIIPVLLLLHGGVLVCWTWPSPRQRRSPSSLRAWSCRPSAASSFGPTARLPTTSRLPSSSCASARCVGPSLWRGSPRSCRRGACPPNGPGAQPGPWIGSSSSTASGTAGGAPRRGGFAGGQGGVPPGACRCAAGAATLRREVRRSRSRGQDGTEEVNRSAVRGKAVKELRDKSHRRTKADSAVTERQERRRGVVTQGQRTLGRRGKMGVAPSPPFHRPTPRDFPLDLTRRTRWPPPRPAWERLPSNSTCSPIHAATSIGCIRSAASS